MSEFESRKNLLKSVVKIIDKTGQMHGLGFFIQISSMNYCVTFYHCINKLDLIFIQDWRGEKYLCEFSEIYSHVDRDVAVLTCENFHVHPLEFLQEFKANTKVIALHFETNSIWPAEIHGAIIEDSKKVYLPDEEGNGPQPWNKSVPRSGTFFILGNISGYSHLSPKVFDGGPILTYDNYVLGMAVKINDEIFFLCMEEILSGFSIGRSNQFWGLPPEQDSEIARKEKTDNSSNEPLLVTNEFYNDNPTDIDSLGRKSIALVLSKRIQRIWNENDVHHKNSEEKTKAFIMNIDGPWGSGKTSLFELIKKELKDMKRNEKCRWISVEFNAWEHQRFNPPWWFLMDQVYRQGLHQLSSISKNIRSKIRLDLRRTEISIRERWWRLTVGRFKLTLILAFVLFGLFLIFISGVLDIPQVSHFIEKNQLPTNLTDLLGLVTLVISVITGVYSVKSSLVPSTGDAVRNFMKIESDPSQHFSKHFKFLIKKLKQPTVIFIDDLDRCKQDYVVEFIEGIQNLFRGPNVIFIIASDKRWIHDSYANAYNNFYSVNEPGRSIGFLFLEKIFQLSLSIPKLSESYKNRYLKELLGPKTAEDKKELRNTAEQEVNRLDPPKLLEELNKPKEDLVYDQYFREEAVKKLEEKESVTYTEHWLEKYSHLMEGNPRSMKRLLNFFSLYRAFLIIGTEQLNYVDLAIWSILKLRWPELAEYIETIPNMIDNIGTSDQDVLKQIPENLRTLFTNKNVIDVRNAQDVGSALSSVNLRKLIER